MINFTAYIPYSDFSATPNPDISRIEWGQFGSTVESGIVWFFNWIKYLLNLLFSVPVSSAGATFMGVLIFFMVIFVVIRMFLPGTGSVPNKITGGGADYK